MTAESPPPPSGELAAVLDASLSDPALPNGNHAPVGMDDAQIEQMARAQEQSRQAFDAVLEKSSEQWRAETDPKRLADALVTILDQIRGPALTRVGPSAPSNQHSAPHQPLNHQHNQDVDMEQDVEPPTQTALDHRQNGVIHSPAHDHADSDAPPHSVPERAKYIPLRLSQTERKLLRLVEAALNVSEYTDVVDVLATSRMKTKQRVHTQRNNFV